jgi:hypothetical protein
MVSEWREIDEGRLPAVAVGASTVPCKLTSRPVRFASRRFLPGRSGRTRGHNARKPVLRERRKGRPLMIAAATWLLTSTDNFRRNHCDVFARFGHSA